MTTRPFLFFHFKYQENAKNQITLLAASLILDRYRVSDIPDLLSIFRYSNLESIQVIAEMHELSKRCHVELKGWKDSIIEKKSVSFHLSWLKDSVWPQTTHIFLYFFSVWSSVLDHVAYVRPSNWLSSGPKWCCWRREMPSQGTTCCTFGPSPSRTSGALGPKSFMGSSALVLSIISVSQEYTTCIVRLCRLCFFNASSHAPGLSCRYPPAPADAAQNGSPARHRDPRQRRV